MSDFSTSPAVIAVVVAAEAKLASARRAEAEALDAWVVAPPERQREFNDAWIVATQRVSRAERAFIRACARVGFPPV